MNNGNGPAPTMAAVGVAYRVLLMNCKPHIDMLPCPGRHGANLGKILGPTNGAKL